MLLDRRGEVAGVYRKVHPVAMVGRDDLETGITPGSEFPVFDCDFGKLGIQICWDIVFDDGWQALADKGAEIVVWPSASPATALPAARAGRHRYFVVSSCWRNNATIYEPTGLVAARVESPEKPLVHQIDLSYAVLGWSAHLREGKAFRDHTATEPVITTSLGKTWACSGPTIPPRRSAIWSEPGDSRTSMTRSRAIAGCKTPRGVGPLVERSPRIAAAPAARPFKETTFVRLLQATPPGTPAVPRRFRPAWLEIIEKNVPYYASLPEADRRELQGLVQVFLAEKNFEGCGGLELTDEIKVTIAAHACRAPAPSRNRSFPAADHDPGLSLGLRGQERSNRWEAGSYQKVEEVRARRSVEGWRGHRLVG